MSEWRSTLAAAGRSAVPPSPSSSSSSSIITRSVFDNNNKDLKNQNQKKIVSSVGFNDDLAFCVVNTCLGANGESNVMIYNKKNSSGIIGYKDSITVGSKVYSCSWVEDSLVVQSLSGIILYNVDPLFQSTFNPKPISTFKLNNYKSPFQTAPFRQITQNSSSSNLAVIQNSTIEIYSKTTSQIILQNSLSFSKHYNNNTLVTSLLFTPNPHILLSGGFHNKFKFFDLRSHTSFSSHASTTTTTHKSNNNFISAFHFSPFNVNWFTVSDSNSNLFFYDTRYLKTSFHVISNQITSSGGHIGKINTVQWSNTHIETLASSGIDKTVRIWNLNLEPYNLAFSSSTSSGNTEDSVSSEVVALAWETQGHGLVTIEKNGTISQLKISQTFYENLFENFSKQHQNESLNRQLEKQIYLRNFETVYELILKLSLSSETNSQKTQLKEKNEVTKERTLEEMETIKQIIDNLFNSSSYQMTLNFEKDLAKKSEKDEIEKITNQIVKWSGTIPPNYTIPAVSTDLTLKWKELSVAVEIFRICQNFLQAFSQSNNKDLESDSSKKPPKPENFKQQLDKINDNYSPIGGIVEWITSNKQTGEVIKLLLEILIFGEVDKKLAFQISVKIFQEKNFEKIISRKRKFEILNLVSGIVFFPSIYDEIEIDYNLNSLPEISHYFKNLKFQNLKNVKKTVKNYYWSLKGEEGEDGEDELKKQYESLVKYQELKEEGNVPNEKTLMQFWNTFIHSFKSNSKVSNSNRNNVLLSLEESLDVMAWMESNKMYAYIFILSANLIKKIKSKLKSNSKKKNNVIEYLREMNEKKLIKDFKEFLNNEISGKKKVSKSTSKNLKSKIFVMKQILMILGENKCNDHEYFEDLGLSSSDISDLNGKIEELNVAVRNCFGEMLKAKEKKKEKMNEMVKVSGEVLEILRFYWPPKVGEQVTYGSKQLKDLHQTLEEFNRV